MPELAAELSSHGNGKCRWHIHRIVDILAHRGTGLLLGQRPHEVVHRDRVLEVAHLAAVVDHQEAVQVALGQFTVVLVPEIDVAVALCAPA